MSRLRLGGYGIPIPVPDDIPEASSDSIANIPRVTYDLADGSIFRPAEYLALHYTHYEVVVIGAVGGNGSKIRGNETAPPQIRYDYNSLVYGGAGGGGGLHAVKGRLIDLPAEIPIVVGQPGLDNTEGIAADGGDGGASQFGEVAQASGGKGGKAGSLFQKFSFKTVQSGYIFDHYTGGGNGGDGGKGGQILAGGGALGGRFIQPVPPATPGGFGTGYHSFEAEDGTWDGVIGAGGGGGMGGAFPPSRGGYIWSFSSYQRPIAVHPGTSGGKGSFSRSDTTRFMDGQTYSSLSLEGWIVPGHGGGATTNRRALGSNYGGYETRSLEQSHLGGVVLIKLRRKQ